MEIKSGVRTTEFWVSLAPIAAGLFLTIFGGVQNRDALIEYGIYLMLGTAVPYSAVRAFVKQRAVNTATGCSLYCAPGKTSDGGPCAYCHKPAEEHSAQALLKSLPDPADLHSLRTAVEEKNEREAELLATGLATYIAGIRPLHVYVPRTDGQSQDDGCAERGCGLPRALHGSTEDLIKTILDSLPQRSPPQSEKE